MMEGLALGATLFIVRTFLEAKRSIGRSPFSLLVSFP